jgi:hypothetical protein
MRDPLNKIFLIINTSITYPLHSTVTIKLLPMTNNNKHHFLQTVFPRQSDPAIEQLLPTSGLVHADQHTNVFHPAGMPRISPLDVKDDIQRALARQPADQIGEWPHRPTHRDPRPATDFRTRPDGVPTHTRLSEPNGVRDTHHRQVVTLIQFDSHHKSESRRNTNRPGTGTNSHSPGEAQNRECTTIRTAPKPYRSTQNARFAVSGKIKRT